MSRLSPERESEIFAATLRLVAERGFDAVTMDAIAAETHSSKATLYRQWGDKIGLVVEALADLHGEEPDLPDTGSLAGDLHALVDQRFAEFADAALLLSALLHAAARDADLDRALRERFVTGDDHDPIGLLVRRAADRGEIVLDPAVLEHLPVVFAAPIVLHRLTREPDLHVETIHTYIDDIILPILTLRES